MQAVICQSFDGPEALEIGQFADPVPGAGEIPSRSMRRR